MYLKFFHDGNFVHKFLQDLQYLLFWKCETYAVGCSFIKTWSLMILTRKCRVLLSSVQEFIEIKGWLLLTFFICLHNQLSSLHSILHINKVYRCLNKIFDQTDRKWMVAAFSNFYSKIWVGSGLNIEKGFLYNAFIIKPRERAWVF